MSGVGRKSAWKKKDEIDIEVLLSNRLFCSAFENVTSHSTKIKLMHWVIIRDDIALHLFFILKVWYFEVIEKPGFARCSDKSSYPLQTCCVKAEILLCNRRAGEHVTNAFSFLSSSRLAITFKPRYILLLSTQTHLNKKENSSWSQLEKFMLQRQKKTVSLIIIRRR